MKNINPFKKLNILKAMLALTAVVSVEAFSNSHTCKPVDVMSFSSRIHVRCSNPKGGINYFAVSTKNKTNADRFLKVATTALVSGKKVYVNYGSSNTSGASFGCLAKDCRKATYFGIK